MRIAEQNCSVCTFPIGSFTPSAVAWNAIYLCSTDQRGISTVQPSCMLVMCYDSRNIYWIEFIRLWDKEAINAYFLALSSWMTAMLAGHLATAGVDLVWKTKIMVAVSKAENGIPLFVRRRVVKKIYRVRLCRRSSTSTLLLYSMMATGATWIWKVWSWTPRNMKLTSYIGYTRQSAI